MVKEIMGVLESAGVVEACKFTARSRFNSGSAGTNNSLRVDAALDGWIADRKSGRIETGNSNTGRCKR